MKGIIIKGIGGFYYVKTSEGIFQARGRGIFRKNGITLTVGDNVDIEVLPDGDAVINSLYERKNIFIRPPIANIDCFIIVMAASHPKPNFSVVDKFLIMSEQHKVKSIICINKCDLASERILEKIDYIYGNLYPTVYVTAKQGKGIGLLTELIRDQKVAFAGPSGVGKSTITNLLIPEANMETNIISHKTSRGKHTTRHVEIFDVPGGGMIFDTPGFTSFDIMNASEENLMDFYPEIAKFKGTCRFDNCRHIKEPGCKVREAVESKKISKARYESYLTNMEEIRNRKKY